MACAAAGVVVLSSLAASGAAVVAVKEDFKTAKDTMQKLMAEKEQEPEAAVDGAQKTVESNVQEAGVIEESAPEETCGSEKENLN